MAKTKMIMTNWKLEVMPQRSLSLLIFLNKTKNTILNPRRKTAQFYIIGQLKIRQVII
jgi:hypothetical protein